MPGFLSSLVALLTQANGGGSASSWDSGFGLLAELVIAVRCYGEVLTPRLPCMW